MSQAATDLKVLTRLELYFSTRQTLRTMRLFAGLFRNDYDLVMIFLAVAEVGLQAIFHLAPAASQPVEITDLYDKLGTTGISIFGIAEATGIPRETVRRKVHQLVANGFLAIHDKDKNVYVPASALSDPEVLAIMNLFVNDIGALVRSIEYYRGDSPAIIGV